MLPKAIGQNWKPYNPAYKYNYATSDLFRDIAVIKTDSFKIIDSDTIYYLNTIIADYTIPPYNYPIVLPQFLMKTMRNTDDKYYVFQDTSSYAFKMNPSAGDPWIFDSIHTIAATVSRVFSDTIFGQQDSMKCIILSTSDTIILSKYFGIVSFEIPNSDTKYKLIGIENLNLGFRVPGYLDFFNFSIGDVFEYKEVYQHNGWSVSSRASTTSHYKFTVLGKNVIANGFQYDIVKQKIDSFWSYSTPLKVTFDKSYESLVYLNDTNSFLNYYNHQGYIKIQNTKIDFSWNTLFKVNVKKYDAVPGPHQESAAYGVGVGLTEYYDYQYNWAGGDDRIYKNLTGSKKDGKVFGVINPDFYFTDINQITNTGGIAIFPNPAVDFITILSNFEFNNADFWIYDIKGDIMFSGNMTGKEISINLSSFCRGTYIFKIISGDMVLKKTIIKM